MHKFSTIHSGLSFFILLALISITACTRKVSRVNLDEISENANFEIIGFLKNGETERTEIRRQLGPIRCSYEGGRIVTYCLNKLFNGKIIANSRSRCCADAPPVDFKFCKHDKNAGHCDWNLVVVFDSDDKVERYSLIKTR